jgi:hypothetical protein
MKLEFIFLKIILFFIMTLMNYAQAQLLGGSILGKKWDGKCGAYIAPGVWKRFLCHNLGADTNANPFTPSASIHGAKYQWGAQTGESGRYISQSEDQNNVTTFLSNVYKPNQSWSDSVKTANDPCPNGYRVPTLQQWIGIVDYYGGTGLVKVTKIGTFIDDPTNYGSMLIVGDHLPLPAAGERVGTVTLDNNNLPIASTTADVWLRGSITNYWSSTQTDIIPQPFALQAGIFEGRTNFSNPYIIAGFFELTVAALPVRCIEE